MVVSALLAERYPSDWTNHKYKNIEKDHDGFVVSAILHSMVACNVKQVGEEADAGGGGKSSLKSRRTQDDANKLHKEIKSSKSSELDHRALQTAAADLDLNELVEQLEAIKTHEFNPHKESLLSMLSGKSNPAEMTILAATLFASMLEHDAIDDVALQTLDVLPSTEASPFETAIADYLETHFSSINWALDVRLAASFDTAAKNLSTLGIMLLEVSGDNCL